MQQQVIQALLKEREQNLEQLKTREESLKDSLGPQAEAETSIELTSRQLLDLGNSKSPFTQTFTCSLLSE